MQLDRLRAVFIRDRDVYEPDGLRFAAAVRPRDAGRRKSEIRARCGANALRHLKRAFPADCGMRIERGLGNAKSAHFGFVLVGDVALGEKGGAAGNVDERACDHAARAAFGKCERFAALGEKRGVHLGKRFALIGVERVADAPPDLLNHGTQHGLARRVGLALCGEPERDLAGLCVGCNGGVRLVLDHVAQQIGELGFSETEDAEFAGIQVRMADTLEIGQHEGIEHREQLARRSGQQDRRLAVRFHDAAGRRAIRVREQDRIAGEAGLLEIVRRHFASLVTEVGGEPLDLLRNGFAVKTERGGDGLFGEVVVRGAEAAREKHYIRAGKRRMHDFRQTRSVVADRDMIAAGKAERGDMPRNVLRVGIQNLSHEKLGTDGDDLCNHFVDTRFLFLMI